MDVCTGSEASTNWTEFISIVPTFICGGCVFAFSLASPIISDLFLSNTHKMFSFIFGQVGFGGVIFPYIPGLYQGLLILMGFDQGIPKPVRRF